MQVVVLAIVVIMWVVVASHHGCGCGGGECVMVLADCCCCRCHAVVVLVGRQTPIREVKVVASMLMVAMMACHRRWCMGWGNRGRDRWPSSPLIMVEWQWPSLSLIVIRK